MQTLQERGNGLHNRGEDLPAAPGGGLPGCETRSLPGSIPPLLRAAPVSRKQGRAAANCVSHRFIRVRTCNAARGPPSAAATAHNQKSGCKGQQGHRGMLRSFAKPVRDVSPGMLGRRVRVASAGQQGSENDTKEQREDQKWRTTIRRLAENFLQKPKRKSKQKGQGQ